MMETESGNIEKGGEGNTDHAVRATFNHPAFRWVPNGGWVEVTILLLAAFLRLWTLGIKPAHFDEGVNGFFVDEMTRQGYYHYDPTNFHGPLHFYVLFVMQTLFGRSIEAFRIPLALASVGCVWLTLFGFRQFFSVRASRLAAVAMAVSPAFVFYGRYAIHETWLVLFLMIMTAGAGLLFKTGEKRYLWWVGVGLVGAVLTKETWIIHVVAAGLGIGTLRLLERYSKSSPLPWNRGSWTFDDVSLVILAGGMVVILFYSGGLLDPAGLKGFGLAFIAWTQTGVDSGHGHGKPWWYWLDLVYRNEWPLGAGIAAAFFVVRPGIDRFVRWFGIVAMGTLTAYAIVHYKTPWCLIAWGWPFFLLFGVAAERLAGLVDRWVIGTIAGVLVMASLAKCRDLNFTRYCDETEPYVYVQTTLEINELLDPLRWQIERDPESLFGKGVLRCTEQYPMRWLLGDRPYVSFGYVSEPAKYAGADWVLVDESQGSVVESQLEEPYFRKSIRIRGMATGRSMLYFRADSFADCFPDRAPEFIPDEATIDADANEREAMPAEVETPTMNEGEEP